MSCISCQIRRKSSQNLQIASLFVTVLPYFPRKPPAGLLPDYVLPFEYYRLVMYRPQKLPSAARNFLAYLSSGLSGPLNSSIASGVTIIPGAISFNFAHRRFTPLCDIDFTDHVHFLLPDLS